MPKKEFKPIEGKWYPAYAYHKWVGPEDVMLHKPYSTYNRARKYADKFRCDDDTSNAFLYKEGTWWQRFYKKDGTFIVIKCDEHAEYFIKEYPYKGV